MTTIGYARVSTPGQSLDLQVDALTAAGAQRIYSDVASGAITARPGLDAALASLTSGDTLIIWRLDRLGRSLAHLVATVDQLAADGVTLRSLHEAIDTSTATGRLTLTIFAALAEFEHQLTAERTAAGLAAARARGARIGRPTVWTPERDQAARAMQAAGATPTEIARALAVSRASVYRHVGQASAATAEP
ncbi:recombinase family protein [Actinomyces procaprae]|uniref:recombinase family protein n=1 Tax=Actinomyces procaprae TaxID=2560010 RepID=UPI00109DCE76|nr:recombinase family protein [Actinomyces procaprae]